MFLSSHQIDKNAMSNCEYCLIWLPQCKHSRSKKVFHEFQLQSWSQIIGIIILIVCIYRSIIFKYFRNWRILSKYGYTFALRFKYVNFLNKHQEILSISQYKKQLPTQDTMWTLRNISRDNKSFCFVLLKQKFDIKLISITLYFDFT